MKSNGQAELRRSYEQLVDAYHALERENQKLSAENKRLRDAFRKNEKPEQVKLAKVEIKTKPIKIGGFVDWVDARGMAHRALVLEILSEDRLKLRISRHARPDVELEASKIDDSKRDGWRHHVFP